MPILTAATLTQDGPLSPLRHEVRAHAPEGTYVTLTAAEPPVAALVISTRLPGPGTAAVVPLGSALETRLETARRLQRALASGRPFKPVAMTRQRRTRLKRCLRALDGQLSGADYRTIARALHGRRVPKGTEWRTHSLRSATIRLVQDGLALMRGGYLDLLKPKRGRRR